MPVVKYCAVYNLRFEIFHGMEEVVGSIPTRSTNNIKHLAPPSATLSHLYRKFQTTPREGFAHAAETCVGVFSEIAVGTPRTSFLGELLVAIPERDVIGGSGAGDVLAFFDNSAWIASSVVRTPGRRTCI